MTGFQYYIFIKNFFNGKIDVMLLIFCELLFILFKFDEMSDLFVDIFLNLMKCQIRL